MQGNVGPVAHVPEPDLLRRRITKRGRQRGMSEEAGTRKAHMSPHYLRQLAATGTGFAPGGRYRAAALRVRPHPDRVHGHRIGAL